MINLERLGQKTASARDLGYAIHASSAVEKRRPSKVMIAGDYLG